MPAFTTIAAATTLAATAGTTGMSFAQASKQRKIKDKAERDAAILLNKAEKRLDVNYLEALGINKEPYALEREATNISAAQAIEAGKESDRGAAATAGRVYGMAQQGQRQISSAMGTEMTNLDKAIATEDARLAGAKAGIDLAGVEGAQQAASDAQAMQQKALQQGMQGVVSLASQASSLVPLFAKTQGAKDFGAMQNDFGQMQSKMAKKDPTYEAMSFQQAVGGLPATGGMDFGAVGSMTPYQFQDFMSNLTPEQMALIKAAVGL